MDDVGDVSLGSGGMGCVQVKLAVREEGGSGFQVGCIQTMANFGEKVLSTICKSVRITSIRYTLNSRNLEIHDALQKRSEFGTLHREGSQGTRCKIVLDRKQSCCGTIQRGDLVDMESPEFWSHENNILRRQGC